MFIKQATRNSFLSTCLLACAGLFLLAACSKDPGISSEEQAMQYLTGMGNRYWHIKDIYINGTMVALTTHQQQYTKTYTRKANTDDYSGVFVDSDGMAGNWQLNNLQTLTEIIINAPNGNDTIVNTINKLGPNEIDMTYTGANNEKVRMVYFGY